MLLGCQPLQMRLHAQVPQAEVRQTPSSSFRALLSQHLSSCTGTSPTLNIPLHSCTSRSPCQLVNYTNKDLTRKPVLAAVSSLEYPQGLN